MVKKEVSFRFKMGWFADDSRLNVPAPVLVDAESTMYALVSEWIAWSFGCVKGLVFSCLMWVGGSAF